jgi:sec-independent protein translocase protein TatA
MSMIGIGPMEIAVIAVIALLVLGPQKLPETARAVGKGMRELRESFATDDDEDDEEKLERDEEEEPAAQPRG